MDNILLEAGTGLPSRRAAPRRRVSHYIKLALAVLVFLGVALGAVFTTSNTTIISGGGHRRALLAEGDGAALDLDHRFDALLNARLADLAEQNCVKIPDPTVHRHEIVFDPPAIPNAQSRLSDLTVIEGDVLFFTNHDQNTYTNAKQTKPWLSDVWQTTSVDDYDACRINVNGQETEATKRLFWSTDVHAGKAEYRVPAAADAATLYFTTAVGWKRMEKWGWCTKGLKLTVNVVPRPTVVKCDGSLANLFLGQSLPDGATAAEATTAAIAAAAAVTDEKVEEIEKVAEQQAALVDALSQKVARRASTIAVLSQQLMQAQQQTEQRVRSEGSSGYVDVRGFKGGIDAYADSSFVGRGVGAIHNHGNFMDTMGMGEVEVVLNGVMFKTRHNDYRLQTPSYTSGEYGAVEPVAFPEVPQRVLDQPTVPEEVAEMQKWFKAWKHQDATAGANGDGIARDYTQHFRPVLCYLEGAWITDDSALLSQRDPDSDRHELEASNMFDLHNKTAYMANSGRKNTRENLAFVPSAVRRMVLDAEGGDAVPEVANFESRIACQLLSGDVPTARFRVAQDLHVQLAGRPLTRAELGQTRRARFEVHPNPNPSEQDGQKPFARWNDAADVHQRREYEYLDVLMEQVTGKDNNVAGNALFDDLEGNRAMHRVRDEDLDVSKYSRFYQLRQKDAMGFQSRRRGFSDRYMWAARTTQKKVSPVAATFGKASHKDKEKVVSEQRWTYAIPIEVIYLTPLTQWNPYNIENHTPEQLNDKAARRAAEEAVTAGGVDHDGNEKARSGKCHDGDGMALNGVKRSLFYRTPVEFFEAGQKRGSDPADTSGSATGMCVLDATGVVRRVAASGHHVFIPSVAGGVGSLRQRYPVMPLHVDGNTGYKETKALAALTLGLPEDDGHDHDHTHTAAGGYEHARGGVFGDSRDHAFGFSLVLTGGDHEHTVDITAEKLKTLEQREVEYRGTGKIAKVIVGTEERNAHSHIIAVSRRPNDHGDGGFVYTLEGCKAAGLAERDGGPNWRFECVDMHNAVTRSGRLAASLQRVN